MQRRTVLTAVALFLSFLQGVMWEPFAAEEQKLVIIHLNDIHARLDTFPKAAAWIEKERRQTPNLLLLSAGDNFTGNPAVDQFEPPGLPIMEFMNKLSFDAAAFGNHEFDYGQEILGQHMRQARFPFLCANIEITGGTLPSPVPFLIKKTRDGLRIAILGLIQRNPDTGIPDSHPDRLKGLRFSDPQKRAKEFQYLRQQCDVFVALSHLGFEEDIVLAQSMPELDVIIGGHSHTLVREPKLTNGVLIVQAGGNLQFLGRIELTLQNQKLVQKTAGLIELAQLSEEDPWFKNRVQEFNNNPRLMRVLAVLSAPLQGKEALGSLMCDAVKEALSLDFVFQNNGGIRVNSLSGNILVRDIYRIDPFSNDIIVFRMTPAEIRGLITSAFNRRKEIDLQAGGLSYEVIPDAEGKAAQVRLKNPDGSPLEENRSYRVGLNSYIAAGYRFAHQDPGASAHTSCAESLLKFIGSGKDLNPYRTAHRARIQTPSP